jgi:hypothetical protein
MFEETLECLPSAERVVVTRDYDRDTAFPAYVEFYDSVESRCSRSTNARKSTVSASVNAASAHRDHDRPPLD